MNEPEILDIRVLGGLDIRCGNRKLAFPTRHSAVLLAVLALSPSGQVDREVCATLMWGERGDEQARASLRQAIYHAQKVLAACGAAPLVADRRVVGLTPDSWCLDVKTLLERCQSDPASAAVLYRGEFLAGLGRVDPAFEDWVRTESEMITTQLQAALRPAAETAQEMGQLSELESIAAALLRLDPFDERALRYNMTALAGQNRRPAALKAYNSFEIGLKAELDLSPESETLALRDQLKEEPVAPSFSPPPVPQDRRPGPTSLRERRAVSLLLLRPVVPISDPEQSVHWLEELTARLTHRFADTRVVVMHSIGATVACVFGGRGPVERHAEDAALAALSLIAEADGQFRVAVVCGDIVNDAASALSPADASTVAHLVEEATVLAEAAPPERPVVSRAVADRLGMDTDSTSPGVILAEESLAGQSTQSVPFIAREAELAEISSALDACRTGSGRIVGLVGEAGIGKSSLVRAFTRATDTPRLVMEARARNANHPFAALSMLYRDWLGVARGEVPENAVRLAADSKHLPAETIPALCDILGLPPVDPGWIETPPGLRRRRIHELVVATLVEFTSSGPAILVAEDLHWMDPDTLSLLDRAIEELPALPLLIVATYRPEYQSNWIGRSFFHFVRIAPLSSADSHNLLDNVLAGRNIDSSTRSDIVERCAGVPYFLVETARSLDRAEGLPASIRDVLAAHVQTLPPLERRVLQCASVLGMDADADQLRLLTDLAADHLDDALSRLRKEELLLRQPGHHGLRFRHALLHETVYASIPHNMRTSLHSEALDGLLDCNLDGEIDQVSIIAHHAVLARRWKDAVDWCSRAGDRYAELSCYGLACDAYQSAAEALEHVPEGPRRSAQRIDLALKQRPVLVPLGHYERAKQELDCAEKIVADMCDGVLMASVEINKSYLLSTHGRLADAVVYAQKAIASAPFDDQTSVEAQLALGQALSLMGDWKSTITTLKPTLPFWAAHPTDRFGHTGTRAIWCHGHLSHAFALNAAFESACEHAEQAFAIATETKRPLDMIFALHRLGSIYLAMGEVDEAVATLEEATTRAEEIDAPIFQVWFACDTVPTYLSLGRIPEARALLTRQFTMANRLNLKQFLAWLILRRAELSSVEGNQTQAHELATQALLQSREIGDLVLEPKALLVRAQNSAESHQDSAAALKLARERGLKVLAADEIAPSAQG